MPSTDDERNKETEPWTILPATEQEHYLRFHERAWQEDLAHAEKNMLEFPRWSIISGYYAMHDLTKLLLAQRFRVKIASPEIHSKAIKALERFLTEEQTKERVLALLKEAKDIYYSAERLKERTLPALLRRGRQERGRAQYYTEEYTKSSDANAQKAAYFLDTIVKPYVALVTGLMR